jgi:hypothetical protein
VGWSCTLVDRHVDRRRDFAGGMSSGSILIAEMMGTLQAMLWYDEFHGHARKTMLRRSTLEVHVLTDNATTVKHWATVSGNGQGARKLRRKRPLWDALLHLERSGYILHFHWIPRATIGLNILGDKVAAIARTTIAEIPERYERETGRRLGHEIYTINASV